MAIFENSIMINRPIDEVFALLSNAENDPKWQSRAVEVKKTSRGPIGLDTTWRSVSQLLGRRIENEMEYTEFEAGWKFTSKSKSGPFPFESRVTFARVAGVTSVKIAADVDTGDYFQLSTPLLVSTVRREIQDDLANLKNLMESRAL